MPQLFDAFPDLQNDVLLLHKMAETDVDALMEITENENVYRYIAPFLYKKSRNTLLTAIRNLNGRDFEKKKLIIAGLYLQEEPQKLIGLAEMFDYKKRTNSITIGYRVNEAYWHRGVATNAVALMKDWLLHEVGLSALRASVLPENVHSAAALLRNGFVLQEEKETVEHWGGQAQAQADTYLCLP